MDYSQTKMGLEAKEGFWIYWIGKLEYCVEKLMFHPFEFSLGFSVQTLVDR